MPFGRPQVLCDELRRALPDRPFRVRFWDGTELEPSGERDEATIIVRSPQAIAHLLLHPNELGLSRAYVSGLLAADDLDRAMPVVDHWRPRPFDRVTRLRLALAALRAMGITKPPRRPRIELPPRGRMHSIVRDRRAVRHHYDISNDFFALFLDESMTYSCAVFSRGAKTLEEAQRAKLELVCAKLGLREGERLLDIGCGWGSLVIHAAREHGARVLGITLSEPQAELARRRAEEAGVGDRVEVRVMDWRELSGETFDAIASVGMVEHVGEENIDAYAKRLRDLLRPGGRVLNHGIARLRHDMGPSGPFTQRYIFPDGATLHLSRLLLAFERAGVEVRHVEGLREDYAETLRHWAQRFDEHLDEAVRIAGRERVRAWRLYLRGSRSRFRDGDLSIFQVLGRRP